VTAVTGPKMAWADLAAVVTTIPIPGDHFTMMRSPCVQSLAGQLRGYLSGET